MHISQVSICSMCDQKFRDKELHLIENISLCSQDYIEYKSNQWVCLNKYISDPNDPNGSLSVYKHHQDLRNINILSYIETSYFEEKSILFSVFLLFVRKQDLNIAQIHTGIDN